jgi:lipopolysaccharide transport system ATP-binding protein
MSDIKISASNIGKYYRIGQNLKEHETFLERFVNYISKPIENFKNLNNLTRLPSASGHKDNGIWALKNLNFTVKHGEILGIIGRNGAGKSTLLKILSRITRPTTGHIEIHGRIASLLEVGTGFHRDLTGRENIYLNGAILGMRKPEIERKFDEIVDFAEIETFLDTPVKRYSSGMKVRLAFAVAAHLEPEILLVDEVLAVGDAAFQTKCLGKMDSVSKSGRTILFVSHNMGAISQLCTRCLVIRNGFLVKQGTPNEMIDWYLSSLNPNTTAGQLNDSPERMGDGRLIFTQAYVEDQFGNQTKQPVSGEKILLVAEFKTKAPLNRVSFIMTIYNHYGIPVTHLTVESKGFKFNIKKGAGTVRCIITKLPLPIGRYRVDIAAFDENSRLDSITGALYFDVTISHFFKTFTTPPVKYSTVLVDHTWQMLQ